MAQSHDDFINRSDISEPGRIDAQDIAVSEKEQAVVVEQVLSAMPHSAMLISKERKVLAATEHVFPHHGVFLSSHVDCKRCS